MEIEHIAVDWSGAKSGAHKKIWLASCVGGKLTELRNGLLREDVIKELINRGQNNPDLVVGLDFAFSFPAWFTKERGITHCTELWTLVDRKGEGWLSGCQAPFWGRAGRRRPGGQESYRQTERNTESVDGITPKSVFQIGGAGAVGTGSIRGMPFLLKLREAGFSIWPFETPCLPCVLEIYPRVLTGEVRKGERGARDAYLRDKFPEMAPHLHEKAVSSEDAFDAAVSALVMSRHLTDPLTQLATMKDELVLLEGLIWMPSSST